MPNTTETPSSAKGNYHLISKRNAKDTPKRMHENNFNDDQNFKY